MDNTGKFKKGTQFMGNITRAKMEVVKIERRTIKTESGNCRLMTPMVLIKDLKTGKLFTCGLESLERCNLIII